MQDTFKIQCYIILFMEGANGKSPSNFHHLEHKIMNVTKSIEFAIANGLKFSVGKFNVLRVIEIKDSSVVVACKLPDEDFEDVAEFDLSLLVTVEWADCEVTDIKSEYPSVLTVSYVTRFYRGSKLPYCFIDAEKKQKVIGINTVWINYLNEETDQRGKVGFDPDLKIYMASMDD